MNTYGRRDNTKYLLDKGIIQSITYAYHTCMDDWQMPVTSKHKNINITFFYGFQTFLKSLIVESNVALAISEQTPQFSGTV